MKQLFNKMYLQLSADDQKKFQDILAKLKQLNGDISQLAEEERQLIAAMQTKYTPDGKAMQQQLSSAGDSVDFLTLPFAEQVKQILARDLSNQFPRQDEAIAFAFNHKWLPLECQNQDLIDEFYARFEEDIIEINQWRNDLLETKSDKRMAVGLAWFMVVFQLHKQLVD